MPRSSTQNKKKGEGPTRSIPRIDETTPVARFHATDQNCVAASLFHRRDPSGQPHAADVIRIVGVSRIGGLESLLAFANDLSKVAWLVEPAGGIKLAYATTDKFGIVYAADTTYIGVHLYPLVHGARALAAARRVLERAL